MMHRFLAGVLLIVVVSCVSTQNIDYAKNDLWEFIPSKEIESNSILPTKYLILTLNKKILEDKLISDSPEISLPDTNQAFIMVKLEDSGTMSPELAKKFPNIKSFRGQELDNSSTKVRIDKNSSGLFAMIVRDGQTYFINPIKKGSSTYIVYDKAHAVRGGNPFADQVIK